MTNDAGLTREQIEEWRATFMDIWRAKLIDAPDWAKPHFAAAIHDLNILCDLALKSREAAPSKAMIALCGLTPGGSEYANDHDACVAYVRKVRESQHKATLKFKRERNAARSEAVPERWKPLESAPQDGTEIWVYAPACYGLPAIQCVCAYHPDAGFCFDGLRTPTHWMPLPSAPASAEGAEGKEGT